MGEVRRGGKASRGASPPVLSIASPHFDPATGDPMLPDRAALYSSADAVLFRSDALTRLSGAELDALAGFVLGGGTLAITVARPEDIRHPTLMAFAGGPITRQGVSAPALKELALGEQKKKGPGKPPKRKKVVVGEERVEHYLGVRRYTYGRAEVQNEIGVVTGLLIFVPYLGYATGLILALLVVFPQIVTAPVVWLR